MQNEFECNYIKIRDLLMYAIKGSGRQEGEIVRNREKKDGKRALLSFFFLVHVAYP